jgi:predicted small lipoprotein YifL
MLVLAVGGLVAMALGACGQKGPLKLPPAKPAASQAAPAAPSPAPAPQAPASAASTAPAP